MHRAGTLPTTALGLRAEQVLEPTNYQPVDLNAPVLLMQDGIAPIESSDLRFHQQMVYAVAMKVLETFDRALGRRIYFECPLKSIRRPLRLFLHNPKVALIRIIHQKSISDTITRVSLSQ